VPKQKRPYAIEIEARLQVMAFDEDSARRKVERAFTGGRQLGADVAATDAVWTYAVTPEST
jgi:hypothetical protein